MAETDGQALLEEWRRTVEGLLASAADRAPIPRELLKAGERQVQLVAELLASERRAQGELTARAFAPLDAIFDLLQESGETLRLQAEALESAGRALQETAALMKNQAGRFERTVEALRQPADLAKAAAGAKRTGPKKKASEAKRARQGK